MKQAAEEGISVEDLKRRLKKERKQAKLAAHAATKQRASSTVQKLKAKASATLNKKRARQSEDTEVSPKKAKIGVGRGRGKIAQKTKRPKNGYQLWCEGNRKRFEEQNPGMDFVTQSKRLGEMWQTVPDREKQLWNHKARQLSGATRGRKAGRGGGKLLKSGGGSSATPAPKKAPSSPNGELSPQQSSKSKNKALLKQLNEMKSPGTTAHDAAAHFKLLGDSLYIIGQKLQAHTTPVAVSGSMSVLLDSLLCTLGPLLVVTRSQPDFDVIPPETLSSTLDHIAHIMPGL